MSPRQFVITGEKKIRKHAEQIEINKARLAFEQIGPVQKHLLKWNQLVGKLLEQFVLLLAPLVNTTAPEFPFLMAEKTKLVFFWNKFLPENIVELKTWAFDFVFDVLPDNRLQP